MRLETDSSHAGRRIDQMLADVPGVGSRSHAEKLLRDGLVLVDGSTALKSHRLRAGEVVEIDDKALAAPAAIDYSQIPDVPVLYEDDHVLVVDKPVGLVVHPAPGHKSATLVELLQQHGVQLAPSDDPHVPRPGVVHRLDKGTSGVLMLAKTPDALREMQLAIQERTARREYLALVQGHVPSRAGRIEAPIGRDARDATRQSIDSENPKPAITHFAVAEVLPTTTLLRMRLETGRTHQIRVHLQAIGYPVVADPIYGNSPECGLSRQFLHAARLTFPHPVTKEPVEVAAPLPDDLQAALAEARRG